MAEFKPMVKMMTTEPSVELKLKKGGKVEKKMAYGGMSGAGTMTGSGIGMARGGMMPAAKPMKPSLNARRRAMAARPSGAAPAAPVGAASTMMKKGGAMPEALKEHAAKPASKAHKGLKTGGVVKGNGGGYKKGGMVEGDTKTYEQYADDGNIIKTKSHKTTKVVQAKPDHSPAKTGGVKMGNGGGYKKGGMACATGGVVDGQGGYKTGGKVKKAAADAERSMAKQFRGQGQITDRERDMLKKAMDSGMGEGAITEYERSVVAPVMKKGGMAKKAYATGGSVNKEGAPVAMPQGRKPAPKPVSITELAGTYKTGGKVTPAQGKLQKIFDKENAPAMKAAKKDTNEKYGPKVVKKAYGGSC
jgi:hypothetical protein